MHFSQGIIESIVILFYICICIFSLIYYQYKMTQYISVDVKLFYSLIKKLKSAKSNATKVTLRLLSNTIGNSNDETNFSHKLLTLFKMGLFGDAHGWREKPALPKISHTYPTMRKLDKFIPCLKKIQKIYRSCDTPLEF